MVHPKLTQDPINMQGSVGTISRTLYEDCASYVNFGHEHFGVYNNDNLFNIRGNCIHGAGLDRFSNRQTRSATKPRMGQVAALRKIFNPSTYGTEDIVHSDNPKSEII